MHDPDSDRSIDWFPVHEVGELHGPTRVPMRDRTEASVPKKMKAETRPFVVRLDREKLLKAKQKGIDLPKIIRQELDRVLGPEVCPYCSKQYKHDQF